MIYFDKKSLKVLRYIYSRKDKGVTWGKLQNKFQKDANILFLESLSIEGYTVTKDESGNWIDFKNYGIHRNSEFVSYCTPKGNELLETRMFNFWKWVIPTIISVAALIVSVLGAQQKDIQCNACYCNQECKQCYAANPINSATL